MVSIIIQVFNGANYLTKAIESAINQSYSDIKIIVVNNGFNYGGKTEYIAKSYGNCIEYIKKENEGV